MLKSTSLGLGFIFQEGGYRQRDIRQTVEISQTLGPRRQNRGGRDLITETEVPGYIGIRTVCPFPFTSHVVPFKCVEKVSVG